MVLPHHTQYQVAGEAIEHDTHVLMEEPLTIRAADGPDLIVLPREKGLKQESL